MFPRASEQLHSPEKQQHWPSRYFTEKASNTKRLRRLARDQPGCPQNQRTTLLGFSGTGRHRHCLATLLPQAFPAISLLLPAPGTALHKPACEEAHLTPNLGLASARPAVGSSIFTVAQESCEEEMCWKLAARNREASYVPVQPCY